MSRRLRLVAAGFVLVLLLTISGIHPYDRTTWWLEVAPILITPLDKVGHFEWLSAVLLGQGADDFLGTQGDPWDPSRR